MKSYLILHIDEEFIVGAVGADYGTPHYIRLDDGSSLMWLYFYNDPNLHKVTFGKGYKKPSMDRKPNYIGKFLQSIESTTNKFVLRYTPYPLIELLEESGMMALWKEQYCTHTQSNPDSIPTLLSFSASISDLSKQNFVEYLREHGFNIHSYTIPLAELALKRLLRQNNLKVTAGSTALFLEATNATLHLTKLTYSDGYFLKDGTTKSIVGMGIDPRKRALCRFLVEELNSYTGFLTSNDEKEQEIDRFELDAAEWLRCLDMKPFGRPLNITVSFSRAQEAKRDIPVEKNNLEADTGRYMQLLVSEYKAFLHENAISTVNFCCFVGNCFLSDRIKGKFEDLIGKENAIFFSTNDLSEIISEYPRIDLKRYADEEKRIRERALADELKQRQQREAELAKQAEEEAKRKAENEKEERLRKQREAEAAFNRAYEFDSQGKLQEAKVAIDEAVSLSPANIDYKKVADYLDEKLKKKKEKVLLYMQYLDKGDNLFANGEYEKAKAEYEKARNVDETAAISAKIIDCESSIKIKREKEKEISKLLIEANTNIDKKNFDYALNIIGKILEIDKNNKDASTAKLRIDKEKALGMLKEADLLFSNGDYINAIPSYEKVLVYDSTQKVCKAKIKRCKEKIKEIANQKEQDRLDYLNNKVRKLKELKAKCNAKIRKNEQQECFVLIDSFLEHVHSMGIIIYDGECEQIKKELLTLSSPTKTDESRNKSEETKKVRVPVSVKKVTSVTPKVQKDSAVSVKPKVTPNKPILKNPAPSKQNTSKPNSPDNKHVKSTIPQTKQVEPANKTSMELFESLDFKRALLAFEKEGNSKMVELCGKLNRIQKRLLKRTDELEKTTPERVKRIVEELTEYLHFFKDNKLNGKEIEDLIRKYKSIK